jgi:NADP-dependent 3-hydroxy acid dehydrogenase YdfG
MLQATKTQFPKTKIVVTGASGSLGRAVMDCLKTHSIDIAKYIGDDAKVISIESRNIASTSSTTGHKSTPTGASTQPSSYGKYVNFQSLNGIDLANPEHVQQHAGDLQDANILIHCAGGFQYSLIENTSDATLNAMIDVNYKSAFNLTRLMLPNMKKTYGRILFFSTLATNLQNNETQVGMSSYLASKCSLEMLARCIRAETTLTDKDVKPGVKSTCMMLSILDTPNNRRDMPAADHSKWLKPENVADSIFQLVINPNHGKWQHYNINPKAPVVATPNNVKNSTGTGLNKKAAATAGGGGAPGGTTGT